MHDRITSKTFQGLNWSSAQHDFEKLAQEYGNAVSGASFDVWCAKHYPSSVTNSHRWHSASSIRKFLGEFDQGPEMFRRLLEIENQRRREKRAA